MVFRGGGNKFTHGFTKVFRKTTRGVNKVLDNPFVDTAINMAPMAALVNPALAAPGLGVFAANQFRKVANAGSGLNYLGKINSVNPMRRPVEGVIKYLRRKRYHGGKLNKKQQALLATGIGTLVGLAAAYKGRNPKAVPEFPRSGNVSNPSSFKKFV